MKQPQPLFRRTAALAAGLLLALGASSASAVVCGTLASQNACSITMGGTTTYTFTGLELLSNSHSGGGLLYGAENIGIELLPDGGLGVQLRFTHTPTAQQPGSVFFVNPGQTSLFSLQYQLALTSAVPGTSTLTNTYINRAVGSSFNGGSFGVNTILNQGTSNAVSCVLTPSLDSKNCDLPAPDLTTLTADVTLALSGNTAGNASLLSLSHHFDAIFSAGNDPTPVPEPALPALAAVALAALAWQRRLRRRD